MRRMRRIILPLAALLAMLASTALSYASVVTVDIAGKTVTSDSSTFEAKHLLIRGEQTQLFVTNTTLVPQSFTLKVSGLADKNYDLYVNGSLISTKTAKDYEVGVPLTTNGRIVDSGMIKCLTMAQSSIDATSKKLSDVKASEPIRVCNTLSQASGWCRSGMQADKTWRSVSIVIAPSDRVLQKISSPTQYSQTETATVVARACWLLQQARSRMSHVIKDPILRNDAVVSMTPIDVTATYTTKNGKPHIDAKLVNYCDLPVNGSISMALPKGWKTNAKKLSFKGVKCGQTFAVSFDMLAPSKSAVAPSSVPMAASVSLGQDIYTASCKFMIRAQK